MADRKDRVPLDLKTNRWSLFSHTQRDLIKNALEGSDRAPASKKSLLREIEKVNRLTSY